MLPLQKRKVFASGKSDKKLQIRQWGKAAESPYECVDYDFGDMNTRQWDWWWWTTGWACHGAVKGFLLQSLTSTFSAKNVKGLTPLLQTLEGECEWLSGSVRGASMSASICVSKNVLCSWSFYIYCGVLPRLSWLAGAKKLLIVTAD